MDQRKTKFAIFIAGLVVSMSLLLYAAIGQDGGLSYYLTVDEFLAEPQKAEEGGFRVNGKVKQGTIERMPSGMDVAFVMVDPEGASELPVSYHGIVPDTFVDGADVVVEGALAPNGTFVANNMLAKCPSKYEAAEDYEGSGGYGSESAEGYEGSGGYGSESAEHPDGIPIERSTSATDSGNNTTY